jgi:hypothetical protein
MDGRWAAKSGAKTLAENFWQVASGLNPNSPLVYQLCVDESITKMVKL